MTRSAIFPTISNGASRLFALACRVALVALILAASTALPAQAQSKLEATYRATLGGLPIGRGAWVVELGSDQYSMAASAQAGGVLAILAGGEGSASARGAVQAGKLAPSSYLVNIKTNRGRFDEIRMGINGGAVKELAVEPVAPPNPDRVPVTEAHKRGVIDPMSAGVLPNPSGSEVGPETCQRTLPIFDGRMRYDLSLSFKRIEEVSNERGYSGPAAVCAVTFKPVSGYHPERFAIRYLRENRDMELWLAPVAGTRFVAIYRISVPTMVGTAMLEATRFVSIPKPTKTGATNVSVAAQ